MTLRNPWRRSIRDTLIPVLWLLAVSVLIGVALGTCIANAAPTSSPGEQFAHEHAADVCIALDERPTLAGVLGVLVSLETYGLSSRESGVALAESVVFVCPIHQNLLRQFVTKYKRDRSMTA